MGLNRFLSSFAIALFVIDYQLFGSIKCRTRLLWQGPLSHASTTDAMSLPSIRMYAALQEGRRSPLA